VIIIVPQRLSDGVVAPQIDLSIDTTGQTVLSMFLPSLLHTTLYDYRDENEHYLQGSGPNEERDDYYGESTFEETFSKISTECHTTLKILKKMHQSHNQIPTTKLRPKLSNGPFSMLN
jgi:hypothetical protein